MEDNIKCPICKANMKNRGTTYIRWLGETVKVQSLYQCESEYSHIVFVVDAGNKAQGKNT